MAHKEDAFLEKVILFLMVLVGAVLIFNQFQFSKLTSSSWNILSFLLIIILIGAFVYMLVKKDGETAKKHAHEAHEKKPLTFHEKLSISLVALVAIMVLFNQSLVSDIGALASGKSSGSFIKSVSTPLKLIGSSSGEGKVIGPIISSDGRTTNLVEWETISETPSPADTGNPTQDAIATVVPTGTPFYVLEGPGHEQIEGVTFDDPIVSQQVWATLLGSKRFGTHNEVKLTEEENARWNKIVSTFTCDYCCGGPNSVTRISQCGCAHSYAWQGMAKFFIKYYPEYTDEQIMGEMTKWKGLWYPQGMIQDYLVYTGQAPVSILTHGGSSGIKQQFMNEGNQPAEAQASLEELGDIQGMVGGC